VPAKLLYRQPIKSQDKRQLVAQKSTTRKVPAAYQQFLDRQSVGYYVKRCSNLLSRRIGEILQEHDLTSVHWVVLACLWRQDGQPVTYLAKQLQQIGGTLTGVLDRMEKRKLVKRKRHPQDRRVYRVYLTAQGVALKDELPVLVQKMWTGIFKGIDPGDIDNFSNLINHLLANLSPEYTCALPECDGSMPRKLSRILPPKSLGYRLKTTSMLLSRKFTDRIEPHNVTVTHWIVLCRLWQHDGVPVSEIGQYIEQVGGTLAGVLERMEERGLIYRKVDTGDRRRMLIYLTNEGERLFDVLPPIAVAVTSEMLVGIKSKEQEFLKSFLCKMIENLGG